MQTLVLQKNFTVTMSTMFAIEIENKFKTVLENKVS